MDCVELSDLEEGEILEYESLSPSDTRSDDNENRTRSFELLQKENENGILRIKERNDSDLYLIEKKKKDYMHNTLKNKLKLNEKLELKKSNNSMFDLESISSEEKSDGKQKYFSKENKYYMSSNKERKIRKKHSAHFYGTVEDIMSEIGETICRKSRCNYKKRKSKDLQCSLYKYSDNSYDLWRHKVFSSHLKHRKHKRKMSFNDSDLELKKEKRKKRRKKDEIYHEEDERETKRRQINDFDEMRRNLLEKLKKKKEAEEESKEKIQENSEIQEVEMIIDCTNYVDNPPSLMPENSVSEDWRAEEKNGEDELDLMKLRLIALASNKKKKIGEDILNSKLEDISEKEKYSDSNRVNVDFDRNELLLRAEALKTALLKKHQKRLNKTKVNKLGDGDNEPSLSSSPVEEDMKEVNLENDIRTLDPDAFKENVERNSQNGTRGICEVSSAEVLDFKMKVSEMSESAVISNGSSKKPHPKARNKRRKRKSGSFAAVSFKEKKSEKSEALDEDDRTLRSQLLNDLMKKKSLKDSDKKSVLMDSVQTSANKYPFSVMSRGIPKENSKPLSTVKRNLLQKINNAPKKAKPQLTPPVPNPEIQRIIVHLGSEESSDEDELHSQALNGLCVEKSESSPLREDEKKNKESDFKCEGLSNPENKVIQAAYERSVELLLNQTRKKIEGQSRTVEEGNLATPEAVYKHLPPSQRLEYIKLKQKIAEREKLRNQKKEYSGSSVFAPVGPQPLKITKDEKESVEGVSQKLVKPTEKADDKSENASSNNSSVDNSNCSLSKSEIVSRLSSKTKIVRGFGSPHGPQTKKSSQSLFNNKIKNNSAGVCEKDFKECAAQPKKEDKTAVPSQRNTLLLPSSQALLTKLKLLLKKIKVEKMIEENYEKEISKLKNQLSLFEKKKSEQRFKIKKLGEESMKTYKAIQCITAKFNGKSVPENDIIDKKSENEETKAKEKVAEEKKEEEGLVVPKEPDKEIHKGQSKLDNELNNDDKRGETIASAVSSSMGLQEYKSPLQVFNKVSDCSEKVDPNVMMCQFDLLGICKDEECVYQHLRAS